MQRIIVLLFLSFLLCPAFSVAQDNEIVIIPATVNDVHKEIAGHWLGYIQISEHEKLAISLFAFWKNLTGLPDDRDLEAVLKFNFGGPGSNEYQSESFKNIVWEGDSSSIAFIQEESDLELHMKLVRKDSVTVLRGKVWVKSAAKNLDVVLIRQDPDLNMKTFLPNEEQYISPLAGDYEGSCGSYATLLSIMTVRGVDEKKPSMGKLQGYGIMANIGLKDSRLCSGPPHDKTILPWCLIKHFQDGSYGTFSGKLVLNNFFDSAECLREEGGIFKCKLSIESKDHICKFQRVHKDYFSSRTPSLPIYLDPLKENSPELSEDRLIRANQMAGVFHGYLHYEERNVYQPVTLNTRVLSRGGDIFVMSADSYFYFGDPQDQVFLIRSFFHQYVGFKDRTFFDPKVDSIFAIEDWKAESLKGVIYSQSFGRVGSFKLFKQENFPTLDPKAEILPAITGSFRTATVPLDCRSARWHFKVFPGEQVSKDSFLFQGNFQMVNVPIVPWHQKIEKGSYDFHSGAVGFVTREDPQLNNRIVSGRVLSGTHVTLFWPTSSIWGSLMEAWCPHIYKKE